MDEPVFADKSHEPDDADLARVLGRAKRHWDDFRDHALAADPAATLKWMYTSKKYGWGLTVKGKLRNLVYLTPLERRFVVGFAFREPAVAAAEQSDLPAEVIEMIRTGQKYPEGCAVRLEVSKAADTKIAKKLLAIKVGN